MEDWVNCSALPPAAELTEGFPCLFLEKMRNAGPLPRFPKIARCFKGTGALTQELPVGSVERNERSGESTTRTLWVWCHCSHLVCVTVNQICLTSVKPPSEHGAAYDGEIHALQLHRSTKLPSICSLSHAHFLFSQCSGGGADVTFIGFIWPTETTQGTWPPVRADPDTTEKAG